MFCCCVVQSGYTAIRHFIVLTISHQSVQTIGSDCLFLANPGFQSPFWLKRERGVTRSVVPIKGRNNDKSQGELGKDKAEGIARIEGKKRRWGGGGSRK
jgi:hypothetical protein